MTVLADTFEGKRLNSPNDVAVHASGDIYFTDPPHGLVAQREGQELPFQGVYRISHTDGRLQLLVDDFKYPNGLAFSPDQRTLYIGDDNRGYVRAFDVLDDGSLGRGRLFAETPLPEIMDPEDGGPDGMKVDSEGHLYLTSIGGVWVFDASGKPLGIIGVPEQPANVAWGGPDWRTLFITARTSVYRLQVNVPGIKVGSTVTPLQ